MKIPINTFIVAGVRLWLKITFNQQEMLLLHHINIKVQFAAVIQDIKYNKKNYIEKLQMAHSWEDMKVILLFNKCLSY